MNSTSRDIIFSAWRENTKKGYVQILNLWQKYCINKKINISSPSLEQGINFLSHLFEQGFSYNRICVARSALSSFVFGAKGFGSNFLVTKFMKGCFEKRPNFKNCSKIPRWNVGDVLDNLMKWFPNEEISLKDLSLKCAFLLIISTGQRIQTLSKIKIKNIFFKEENCWIVIDQLLKHSRSKTQQAPLEFSGFKDNEALCPIKTLKDYLSRTKEIRNNKGTGQEQLFISFRKPHKAVHPESISRWIKEVLIRSGVSKDVTAYSTRSISTSTASAAGVPINCILKAAGWSSQLTFAKYYKKEVDIKFNSYLKGKLNINVSFY